MTNETETLRIGELAPKFKLAAANREGDFSLSDLISEGPVVIEFLRGTW
jgi:peroxiredoxin